MSATANVNGEKKVFKDGKWKNNQVEHNTDVVDKNYSCDCGPTIEGDLVIHNDIKKSDANTIVIIKRLMKASLRSDEMSFDVRKNLFFDAAKEIKYLHNTLGSVRPFIKCVETPALCDIVKDLELTESEAVIAGKVYARATKAARPVPKSAQKKENKVAGFSTSTNKQSQKLSTESIEKYKEIIISLGAGLSKQDHLILFEVLGFIGR